MFPQYTCVVHTFYSPHSSAWTLLPKPRTQQAYSLEIQMPASSRILRWFLCLERPCKRHVVCFLLTMKVVGGGAVVSGVAPFSLLTPQILLLVLLQVQGHTQPEEKAVRKPECPLPFSHCIFPLTISSRNLVPNIQTHNLFSIFLLYGP